MIKRSIMTLYSGPLDIYSHQVRMVLAEKGVSVDIVTVDENHPCEDLIHLNPYNTLPTLVDRELVLYNAHVIMEYLDERFPHPPLLPVYPVSRAKTRLMMYRLQHDWYNQKAVIENQTDEAGLVKAKEDLRNTIMSLLPVFSDSEYFLSEDFSLIDCVITPLLWRLPTMDIEIPKNAKALTKYAERAFKRESFQASLTEAERELREPNDFE